MFCLKRTQRGVHLALALLLLPSLSQAYLQYEPEQLVQAADEDIAVPGFSVPSIEDWNEDGLKDLIVGEGGAGTDGKVRIYLNHGSNEAPLFTNFIFAQQAGGDFSYPGG